MKPEPTTDRKSDLSNYYAVDENYASPSTGDTTPHDLTERRFRPDRAWFERLVTRGRHLQRLRGEAILRRASKHENLPRIVLYLVYVIGLAVALRYLGWF